jgi:hypothetical protein
MLQKTGKNRNPSSACFHGRTNLCPLGSSAIAVTFDWQHGLAVSRGSFPTLYERLGKIPEALAELRAGQAIMTALVATAAGHA